MSSIKRQLSKKEFSMQRTYATWNTQGYSGEKWSEIKKLTERADVVFIQEAGFLADAYPANNASLENTRDDLYVYGWSGTKTDGYANNRVSLAIVSKNPADEVGFVAGDTRGLGYMWIGNQLFGTWHENRGQGGLSGCLNRLRMSRYGDDKTRLLDENTICIVGGDFNTENTPMVPIGSKSQQISGLQTSSYNFLHRLTKTHKNGKNLDRIYVSIGLTMVHHWAEKNRFSDHNPVFATIVSNPAKLNCLDFARVKYG